MGLEFQVQGDKELPIKVRDIFRVQSEFSQVPQLILICNWVMA